MKVPPIADLIAVAIPYLSWPLFNRYTSTSGRVAFYCMLGALVVYSWWRVRQILGWRWKPVAWFAAWVGSQQATCGLLYEARGGHVCDDGTGIPFVLLTTLFLLVIAAYYALRSNPRE